MKQQPLLDVDPSARREGTYDEHQIEAPLVTCPACGKAYYMTVVQVPCIRCRQKAQA